jgi:hypothetical protein
MSTQTEQKLETDQWSSPAFDAACLREMAFLIEHFKKKKQKETQNAC